MQQKYQFSIKILPKSTYEYILWPLATIVALLKIIYDWLIHLIWSEMTTKEKEDTLTQLIAFVVISVFAFFMYRFQKYDDFIVISLFVIWFIDYFFTKQKYANAYKYKQIVIEKKGEDITFVTKSDIANSMTFPVTEIKYVGIAKKQVIAGAFLSKIAEVWSVAIYLKNGVDLIIAEEIDVHKAFLQAQKLENWNLRIKFLDSEGSSDYAFFPKKPYKISPLISQKVQANKKIISYHWQWSSFLSLFSTSFAKVGFLLFVCIISNMLIHYGFIAYHIVSPFIGLPQPQIHIDISKFKQIFIPQGDFKDIFEIVIISVAVLYNMWLTTTTKNIEISQDNIQVSSNEVSYLKKLDVLLLITKPEYSILFGDDKKIVEVDNLQTPDDYRTLLSQVEKNN